jgi:hypothetical protein
MNEHRVVFLIDTTVRTSDMPPTLRLMLDGLSRSVLTRAQPHPQFHVAIGDAAEQLVDTFINLENNHAPE